MKHQVCRLTRGLLAALLGAGLAQCGVATEVANRPHPSTLTEGARLASGESRRPARDSVASLPAPVAAPVAPTVAPRPRTNAPAAAAEASPLPALGRPRNVRTQSGRIIDEAGQPLVGATVLLQGTTRGASTDASGGYSFEVPLGLNTFVFGYSGYQDEVAQSRDGQPLTVTLLPTTDRPAASAAPHPAKPRR